MSVEHSTANDQDCTLGVHGYTYADLHQPLRLKALHKVFEDMVKQEDPVLWAEFQSYQTCQGKHMAVIDISDLLVRMAHYVGQFISQLFQVEQEAAKQADAIRQEMDSVFVYRSEIVAKLKAKFSNEDVASWNVQKIDADLQLLQSVAFPTLAQVADREKEISLMAAQLLRLEKHYHAMAVIETKDGTEYIADADAQLQAIRQALSGHANAKENFRSALAHNQAIEFIAALLLLVQRWTYAAQHSTELRQSVAGWLSFKSPKKVDADNLVEHALCQHDGFTTWVTPKNKHRYRDGFALTDERFNERQVLYEVNHCIYCHSRDTDSCSKGMRNKRSVEFKKNKLGVSITGCPLEEKISEMHIVKRQGNNIGALALIIIDNPMCPGTGHRICNECMKGCIYQKTEPVNIPQIETNVLTDVLFMPWGFEIYSLLTRWNPLNIKRPYALPYNGKNILVVGMGPAGYTLSHYLTNEGFAVAGIDALKIEPLADDLIGTNAAHPKAIKYFHTLYEDLDKRILAGFGGVAEYGITARWDKNFLKVIYLNLARQKTFQCYGGVRFGGTITIEDAWDMGFEHVAIASGAGRPTIIGLKNNLIRGIRKASDFLMALQLTGAAKKSSLSNLQVRLPAGVIGGGLTGLDTTTEIMAYYPVQVEKILYRYEKLSAIQGEQVVRERYDAEELIILDEFLQHGRTIRAERQRAKIAGTLPNFQPLIDRWGGVTMFYRKGVMDSPAYKQNHEEICEALQEGIHIAEGMSPHEAVADEYGALQAVNFDVMEKKNEQWNNSRRSITVPLRSLFIAAGTSPNTIYEQEIPYTFRMDGNFFQRYQPSWSDGKSPELVPMNDETLPKIGKPAPLTSYSKGGKFVSFYGDTHPVYAGNVVRAMASAKDGYPYIVKLFDNELSTLDSRQQTNRELALHDFFDHLNSQFLATVVNVNRLSATIIEVVVKAPLQARKFRPGQFYRVQNLETHSPNVQGTTLASESLALTGAWVDQEKGLISLITLEMGSSSRLCCLWKPGDPLVVMGVTGTATTIPKQKIVMLIGGGLGNAVQFSIGKALRAAANKVIYFAGYKKPSDLFKTEDIEQAADVVVWSVDAAPGVEAIQPNREQDKTYVGNVIESIVSYAKAENAETMIKLHDVDHIIAIGSDRMMEAVQKARSQQLQPYLKPNHTAIGSINSPMQCMMKGVCAQCLCKHVDPHTGETYFVYSCYNQDQPLDRVDFANLNARLRQNSVQEKLSDSWLHYLLSSSDTTRT